MDFECFKKQLISSLFINDISWIRAQTIPQHIGNETNEEWLFYRNHRITGSKIASIVDHSPFSKKKDLLLNMLWNINNITFRAPLIHGNKHEESADLVFANWFCHQCEQDQTIDSFDLTYPGIILSRKRNFEHFGYSPDGLVTVYYKDGSKACHLLEYKAPYSKRFTNHEYEGHIYKTMMIPTPFLPDGRKNPSYKKHSKCKEIGVPIYYYDQIMFGMHLLYHEGIVFPKSKNMDIYCYFTVWTFGKCNIYKVPWDRDYSLALIQKATSFWREIYLPKLFLKHKGLLKYGEVEEIEEINVFNV